MASVTLVLFCALLKELLSRQVEAGPAERRIREYVTKEYVSGLRNKDEFSWQQARVLIQE